MASPPIVPAEIQEFVRTTLHSVWALELLLFLRKNAAKSWTVATLVTELRASQTVVHTSMPPLVRSGLIREDEGGTFRYSPSTAELGQTVDRIDALFRESPVALLREIVLAEKPNIQSFADAFKFRKD